jgi:hypothetical protein
MGLTEKRALKEFQDKSYKSLVGEINSLAGYNIEFDVKWDKLALDDYTHLYEEGFSKVYFAPIIDALREITADDMGKQALKDTLKKVVIKNEGDIYYAHSAYSYKDGVLTIDHQPFSNVDATEERSKELASILMKQM